MERLENLIQEGLGRGEFLPDSDAEQIAFELQGIGLAANWRRRLFDREPSQRKRAQEGFARLLFCHATDLGRKRMPAPGTVG
jgi:hypothetical protein